MYTKALLMTFSLLLYMLSFSNAPVSEEIEMQKAKLLRMNNIYEIIGTDAACKVFSFNALFLSSDNMAVEVINRGDTLMERTRALIQKSESGDKIYLESISSANDCLQYQETGSTSFVIRLTHED